MSLLSSFSILRSTWRSLPRFVLLAALCSSCSALTDTSPSVTVRTSQRTYIAEAVGGPGLRPRYEFTLVVETENRGITSVQLNRCAADATTPMFGISLVDATGTERSAYDGAWACLGGIPPIVLAPGETRSDTFEISGPTIHDGYTGAPRGLLDGRMRLSFGSEGERFVSNVFEVVRRP